MLDIEGWRCNGEEDGNVWRKKERIRLLTYSLTKVTPADFPFIMEIGDVTPVALASLLWA